MANIFGKWAVFEKIKLFPIFYLEVGVLNPKSDRLLVNYAHTIRDKVSENALVMKQIANNSTEQAMLGDFSKAVDDAVMDSSDAHNNQMLQLLSDPAKAAGFAKVVFDLLKLQVLIV